MSASEVIDLSLGTSGAEVNIQRLTRELTS